MLLVLSVGARLYVACVCVACVCVACVCVVEVLGGVHHGRFQPLNFFLIDVNAVAMLHMNMHKDFQPLNPILTCLMLRPC